MVKNNNGETCPDEVSKKRPLPEILIPKIVNRICSFKQEIPLKDFSIPISPTFKLELNKFLVDLEKNLESERTKKSIKKTLAANKHISVGKNTLIEHLCGGFLDQPFRIHFHDDVPSPVYRDKPFSLKGNIVDLKNNVVILSEPMIFNALLYKAEHPISQIEVTRYKEKIISGSSVIETSSAIYFRKIAIKEVSSYHPSKMYILVVMPEDNKLVQPFVFPEVVVKTKNLKPCKLRKKFKIQELFKS
ncbi:hypothetical protein SteCoe_8743 [Stentor coeruleus]|uniref:Uncharacterized protein n=1 Tax=Stentor coeruleus TaxID=5963 RepID=A0A1R2CJD2_9CILI|nr:hypothetical protein SteCoe_8743 [Stentor coeruleus]